MKALVLRSNQKGLIFFYLGILIFFCLFFSFSDLKSVFAQEITGTTANVSVSGFLEWINITYNPVNFTAGVGRNPGTILQKVNAGGVGYIIIDMTANTNVDWDAYMNASGLIGELFGATIPPNRVSVWTQDCTDDLPLTSLDTDLILLCKGVGFDQTFRVFFNLSIPVGQHNDTYNGPLWIYVNSSDSENNRTWYGPDNTTVKIIQYIEFWWNDATAPIDFPTMTPGSTSTANVPDGFIGGFPANMTVGDNTNIYTDIYILGTDLIGLSGMAVGPPRFDVAIGPNGNLTYSNATSAATWPDAIKFIDYSYQAPPYEGDFANWHGVPNYTDVSSFWNISMPTLAKQGSYGGEITAKAVDQGEGP